MASMQKYFEYTCMLACGFPSITLLGEKSDFELISRRIEKLSSWGVEPTKFRDLLLPVVKRLIASFDDPTSDATRDFWSRVFKLHSYGSGPTEWSGWITAFCFWDEEGKCLYRETVNDSTKPEPDDSEDENEAEVLCLDGARYHKIDSMDVPPAVCSVPVKIIEYGTEYLSMMVAGSVGIACTSSGQTATEEIWENGKKVEKSSVGLDTLQPQTGWFLFEREEGASREGRMIGDFWYEDELVLHEEV